MKFGIDIGHNCPPDTGASGIKQEDVLTKDVGTRLMAKLSAAGHSVINCTPSSATTVDDSLRKRVNKANSNAVDIFVSIHFSGSYSVLDVRREERHYWVKWPDKSKANRDEHFVFEEHAEIES